MSWREFSYLMTGLSPDTALGRIVSIRAENDPETLKEFTPEQRKIRSDYRKKIAKDKTPQEVKSIAEQLKQAFIRMAK